MQKTFYHFLPEAGKPFLKRADEVGASMHRLEALKQQLKAEGERLTHLTADLWRETTDNWTPDEIDYAKRQLQEQKGEGVR